MKVAILGCGPAGLFAAHAASLRGHSIDILSKKRKSFMRGAQYLHQPIPLLSGKPFQVEYLLDGSVDGYRDKVYGIEQDIQVSPETLVGTHDAWDIREAYDAAWDKYEDDITDWRLGGRGYLGFPKEDYDVVISTVPAPLLCQKTGDHQFSSESVWSTDFVKRQGRFVEAADGSVPDNVVVCSGLADDWWYRASRIHGWENTEYPQDKRPNTSRVWKVEKPISTDCDCHSDILRVGRYGEWTKGVLSHEAFFDTDYRLATLEVGR